MSDSAVSLTLAPLSAVRFAPQTAVATIANPSESPLTGRVDLSIALPIGSPQKASAAVEVAPHSAVDVTLTYELYEPGEHGVTASLLSGDDVVASCETHLTVPDDGAQPPAATWTTCAFAEADNATSIDAYGRLVRHGRPWFPLGCYTPPTDAEAAKRLTDMGFDLTVLGGEAPQPTRARLDQLHAWGLDAWVCLSRTLDFSVDEAAKRAKTTQIVLELADHPALAFWETVDEPSWNGVPQFGLRAGYEAVRALDSRHPVWMNHAPRNRATTLAFYNRAADFAGVDIYPVPTPQTQSDLPNKQLSVVADEQAKNVAAAVGKPLIMVLQAFAWASFADEWQHLGVEAPPNAIYPTLAESRYMAYEAIVGGAAGISYYGTFSLPKTSPFWSVLAATVSELRGLTPWLTALPGPAATVSPSDTSVHVLHKAIGNRHAVFVVNRSEAPARATVTVPDGAGDWRCATGDLTVERADDPSAFTVNLSGWGAGCIELG